MGVNGSLATEKFAAACLNHIYTPDRDTGLSTAQLLFSHKLRDVILCQPSEIKLWKEWVPTQEAHDKAIAKQHQVRGQTLHLRQKQLHCF